ncbi:MAG: YeeE/YedE family protein [Myxococcota bacterium]
MENFTPILSTIGGILIGLSAAVMMAGNGRIAGISGIFRGAVFPKSGDFLWRAMFIAGLIGGGVGLYMFKPEWFEIADSAQRSMLVVAGAGLLVGFGTRLGNGCTSGHGVCGLARFSVRSLVATASFMATGAATVFIYNLIGG